MDFVRHCPRCHADYRPEILTCADCGGDLEIRQEETDPDREIEAASEPPPGIYRSLYYTSAVEDLEPLAAALTRAAIPFRIESSDEQRATTLVPRSRFDLSVRDEEREAARRILAELPDFPEPEGASENAEAPFDPEKGYARCPACSASLAAGTDKCPDCGLTLAGSLEPLLCSDCGAEVSPADSSCPRCGAALEG